MSGMAWINITIKINRMHVKTIDVNKKLKEICSNGNKVKKRAKGK